MLPPRLVWRSTERLDAAGLGLGDAVNTHLLPSAWPSPPLWKEAWWPWV